MKINCVKLSNQIQKLDSLYVSTDGPQGGKFGTCVFLPEAASELQSISELWHVRYQKAF